MQRTLASASLVAAVVVGLTFPHAASAQQGQIAQAGGDVVQGMSRERLNRIAGVMNQEVAKGTFSGAVTLIARRGELVHFEANGFQDAAKTKPMAKDSIFRMASMTKAIVTVAAMMLVEQGVFKINDPIAQYLPELKDLRVEVSRTNSDGTTTTEDVPANRAVTIQDLMRHTSGFFYGGAMKSKRLKEAYEQANIEANEQDITGDEMLKRLGQIPLASINRARIFSILFPWMF
jgi:CubicO group peptidase (beta-lactamase class C family)